MELGQGKIMAAVPVCHLHDRVTCRLWVDCLESGISTRHNAHIKYDIMYHMMSFPFLCKTYCITVTTTVRYIDYYATAESLSLKDESSDYFTGTYSPHTGYLLQVYQYLATTPSPWIKG